MSDSIVDVVRDIIKRDEKTKPYDTTAKVTRIDGGTAWVHIDGGVSETPVSMTIDAKEGDNVQVRLSGGRAWITGNATSPPTDDTTAVRASNVATDAWKHAESAHRAADTAWAEAGRAREAADEANTQATYATNYANNALTQLSTVESVVDTLNWITAHGTMTLTTDTAIDPTHVYFVRDNNGDYVVGSYHYSIVSDPKIEELTTYYVLTIDEAVSNYVATHLSLTNDGLYVINDSSAYKVLLANDGMYIQAPNGTTVNQATANGNVIRATNGTVIANLGYDTGNAESGTSTAPYYTFGTRASGGIGNYSVAEGINTTASGYSSHAEGGHNTASGHYSHAEGSSSNATGTSSHAEGNSNSFGLASHSEGVGTQASGDYSHAEGYNTVASNETAHAEGYATWATGIYSHAQNLGTSATAEAQTVIGKYNEALVPAVSAQYAFIIGNGSSSARSNALTVAWDGNLTLKGHSSPVGTVLTSYLTSAKSVATGTDTNLCSLMLQAGTWLITAGVRFPANATGHRRMNVATTSASNAADVQLPAVNGASTQLAYTLVVSPTATTTYYLNCFQNSGTTLSLIAGGGENGINFMRAVRLI